jgi:hypothetical protein
MDECLRKALRREEKKEKKQEWCGKKKSKKLLWYHIRNWEFGEKWFLCIEQNWVYRIYTKQDYKLTDRD